MKYSDLNIWGIYDLTGGLGFGGHAFLSGGTIEDASNRRLSNDAEASSVVLPTIDI